MENIILETIKILGQTLISLSIIAVMVVQYLKESWKVKDKAAQILSLVIGFLLGLLVVISYLDLNGWSISISQGVGIFLFLVIATISPSGGYKTLRSLTGVGNEKS